ncbi:MAG: CoA transferase [Dehalococcoidia bacterium]
MPKVFEGFTVIELADRRNQFVGKLMSDSGARVIQVEPVTGHPGRWVGPFVEDQEDPDRCLDYWWYNTGKESLAVDITRQPGRDLVRRLAASADVFIESTRPGTLAEHGLDYDTLSAENAQLIYASLTDFGQDGPWVDFEMNDFAHLALGGPMGNCGYSDPHEMPIGGQGHQAYNMASVVMLHTITSALFERLGSDLGQFLDISIHEVCSMSTERAVSYWLWYNEPFLRQTGQHAAPTYRPSQQMPTADGRLIQGTAGRLNDSSWAHLVKWMEDRGVAGELSDPQYYDPFYRAEQYRNGTAIIEGVRRVVAASPAEEAFHKGQEMGLPWTVVRPPEENLQFDHFRERGFWVQVEHEEVGRAVTYPRGFFVSDELGMRPERRAPHLGEHTRSILTADLGLSDTEVAALTETGVAR